MTLQKVNLIVHSHSNSLTKKFDPARIHLSQDIILYGVIYDKGVIFQASLH